MIHELRTYEAAPGKLPALNARFRDHTLGLFERHGMEVIGFWTYAPRRVERPAGLPHALRRHGRSRREVGRVRRGPGLAARPRGVPAQRHADDADPLGPAARHRLLAHAVTPAGRTPDAAHAAPSRASLSCEAERAGEEAAVTQARSGGQGGVQSGARSALQEVAPKLAELTVGMVYDDVWERPGLSKRDRSLITVATLTALYRSDQLRGHIGARARQRRDPGRDRRGHHAHGDLRRLADRGERGRHRQGGLRRPLGPGAPRSSAKPCSNP